MAELSDFILSKVRVKLLQLFFEDPSEMWYVREITRKVDEEINAVRRELDRMTTAGMLHTEDRGNRKYYNLNHQYDFYPELMRLVAKTAGLGQQMKHNRKKLGTIKYVMFTGKFSKHEQHKHDEVEILVVGEVVLPELAALVREEEKKRGHEINYTVMSSDEFEFRKTRRDPFLLGILELPRVMVIGNEEEMLERKPQMP
jgi:DNA-binding transcriptional ArsR family regulator